MLFFPYHLWHRPPSLPFLHLLNFYNECLDYNITHTYGAKRFFSIDVLLVTGAKAPHLNTVYNTHKSMNKKKTTLLVVDNVCDVLEEAVRQTIDRTRRF